MEGNTVILDKLVVAQLFISLSLVEKNVLTFSKLLNFINL